MADKPKFDQVKAGLFKLLVDKVREKGDLYKANIHPYETEEYEKMRTFMSPDRKSGYAIKPSGELVSVHSTVKGRGDDIVKDAIKRGAKKLDAFDIKGKLPELYGKHGFKETGRFPFDPQYAEDLDVLHKNKPDFVTMERKAQTARQLDDQRMRIVKMYRDQYLKGEISEEEFQKVLKKNQEVAKSIGERALEERNAPKTMKVKADQVDPGKMKGRGFTEHIKDKELHKIQGITPKISTKEVSKAGDIGDYWKALSKKVGRPMGKIAKKGVKALPFVGPLAVALASQDASAAVPILGDADPLGPQAGSLEASIEDPTVSREQRKRALQELMKRNKGME